MASKTRKLDLWRFVTHIASVLMNALRAAATRAWSVSSACGSISSGWQSRRSSANLLLLLSLRVIDGAISVRLCLGAIFWQPSECVRVFMTT